MHNVSVDIEAIVKGLKKVHPGFLPYPLFTEVARIVALPILEVVPMRMHHGKVEVLFLKRDAKDDVWPNALHTPGTVIRSTDIKDGAMDTAFRRIFDDELAGTKVSEPVFVCLDARVSLRGAEQAQVYWVEVLDEQKAGAFYSIDALPNLVETQGKFIHAAATAFTEHKRSIGELSNE
jgi:hypothetical protein